MTHNTTAPVEAAIEAYRRGAVPVPILAGRKNPYVSGWTRLSFESEEDVRERFSGWSAEGVTNLGVLLGSSSGGLVDVDLDHPKTARLKHHFLPPTAMKSGRAGRPASHFWYRVDGEVPSTRRHKMPDGSVAVELRSDLAQTVIPPSVHPSGEDYRWEGLPWGGEAGPAVVDGQVLTVQVALLGLGTVLVDSWPREGGRHDAYLALAGGLLRFGEHDVHPYWERNASVIIRALAEGTADEDGPGARESETIPTTLKALRDGKKSVGFTRLSELIGSETVDQVRRLVAEVESAAGFESRNASILGAGTLPAAPKHSDSTNTSDPRREALYERLSALESEKAAEAEKAEESESPRDPLEERLGSWDLVNIEPYLEGRAAKPMPTVLRRDDGQALLYPGRVNMIYGNSESAKSWVALWTCAQEIERGERVLYVDLEDEPTNTIVRLREMGAAHDDLLQLFGYIRPEEPIDAMQRDRWGQAIGTQAGELNEALLERALAKRDPSFIVIDGMTVLYGLHGLDTNDARSTDTITNWLKALTGNGRRTVVVIDHSTKNAEKGALPLGSQHKVSMVQGTLLQAWPVKQPMPGALGEIQLVVLKDRPGQVRAVSAKSGSKAQVAAVVKMDSTEPDRVKFSIEAPPTAGERVQGPVTVDLSESPEAGRAEGARRREAAVLDVLESSGTWLGGVEVQRLIEAQNSELPLMDRVPISAAQRGDTLRRLHERGEIVKRGESRGTLWALTSAVQSAGLGDSESDSDSVGETPAEDSE